MSARGPELPLAAASAAKMAGLWVAPAGRCADVSSFDACFFTVGELNCRHALSVQWGARLSGAKRDLDIKQAPHPPPAHKNETERVGRKG